MKRQLGNHIPISLGTALIFEQPHYDIRKWSNLLYVNLRTLYRNYVASFHPDDRKRFKNPESFLSLFFDEVAQFEHLVREQSTRRIRIYFYYPTYQSLGKRLPISERKEYNPDGYDVVEVKMWEYVRRSKMLVPFEYHILDTELPPANETVTLLSSFVVDLLQANKFISLTLLESYTGKLKTKKEWHTKINVGRSTPKDPIEVPFNRFTLQIFGDKSGAFQGAPINLRRVIRQLAKDHHWNSATTAIKIKLGIERIQDRELKKTLLSYL